MQIAPVPFAPDPDAFRTLRRCALPVDCDHEQLLFAQGDAPHGLYLLTEGRAKLSSGLEGSSFDISFEVAAPSVLGLSGVLGHHQHEFSAKAFSHARLGFVHNDDFQAMVAADPALSLAMLQMYAASINAVRNAVFERMLQVAAKALPVERRWFMAAS